MDATQALAVDLGRGGMLLSELAVDACRRALVQAVERHRADGWPIPEHVRDLIAAIGAHQQGETAVPDADGNADAMPIAAERASFGAEGVLTVAEAAERLGIKERGVRYAVQEGRLPGRKVRGRWQIDAAVVRAAVHQREGVR